MDSFEEYRPLLFSIAYRMLGSAVDAEDIVQDAYIRYQTHSVEEIRSPRAFLTTMVTRLCINFLQSARVQREQYLGPWLPEPIRTDADTMSLIPNKRVEIHETVSMAFLVVLEQLTPAERAVFLLREVFDYSYREIGDILEKDEAACRQLFSRARKHITDNKPRFNASEEKHRELLDKFMSVVMSGDLEPLMNMLVDDAVMWTDGGGQATAAIYPIYGRKNVARFVLGSTRLLKKDYQIEISQINDEPAVLIYQEGVISLLIFVGANDAKIESIRVIANPDKLQHIR
jgi:RNA polymerase sigma-70 factor (ECF subfamily)